MATPRRTIFIGDVHGCPEELTTMLDTLHVKNQDRIIMLGDLINRGPGPAQVVRIVHDRKFECLLGNHEEEYLRQNMQVDKYAALRYELGETLHKFILALPLYIEDSTFLAVHAGLKPSTHPSVTDRRILLNIRTWDGIGIDLKNPGNRPWHSYYKEPKPVFYGHWARQGLHLTDNSFGLDSGCVYGRELSAYILEESQLVQIPAKKVYYEGAKSKLTG